MIYSFRIISTIFLFCTVSLSASDINKSQELSDQSNLSYTMGFEAETSVFKVRPREGDVSYKMTIFKSPENEPYIWAFTSDTFDESVRPEEDLRWMNTECKTLGGLNKNQIINSATQVKGLWQNLNKIIEEASKNNLDNSCIEMNASNISLSFDTYWSEEYDSILIARPNKTNYQKLGLVYPQITFGLPLHEISSLFEHIHEYLKGTEHDIEYFWNGVNRRDLTKEKEYFSAMKLQQPISQENLTDAQKKAQDESSRKISYIMKKFSKQQKEKSHKEKIILSTTPIVSHSISAASGLALLTSFYVYSLFPNMQSMPFTEPGPKALLGIMSRVPFSKMFSLLSDDQKEIYQQLIENNLNEFFDNMLISYTSYDTNQIIDKKDLISFKKWYDSIINPEEFGYNGNDLLSPPPGCRSEGIDYAMGAILEIHPNQALLEIRAYNNKKIDVNIDNFDKLIENEARWFFQLSEKEI